MHSIAHKQLPLAQPVYPRAQIFPTLCECPLDLAAVRILEKVVVDGWKVEKALQWAASEAGLPDDIKELVELALSTKTKPLTGVCTRGCWLTTYTTGGAG